jgi:DNA-binding transcriptional regulator YiaG
MTPAELKQWRKQAGLSQAGLAALLGVVTMTVSRWELGRREIPSFLHLALEALERKS